jgi:hypothetical protein
MRLILICLLLVCGRASGQVIVRINDARPLTLAAQDLAALPRHAAMLNDHGKQVNYEGVLLHDVLAHSGVDFGTGLRGKQLSAYVTAIGSDGYQVVYALADFDPSIRDSGIILADTREGQRLGPKEGPLRVVVPHDERPARSVRMLKEIDVVQLSR